MDREILFNENSIQFLMNNIKIDDLNIEQEIVKSKLSKADIQEKVLSKYEQININGATLVKNQEKN